MKTFITGRETLRSKFFDDGFSLIEVMIAVALMGVAGYALMQMLKTSSMGQKTALAQDDARVLTDNMAQALADPTACANTFLGVNPVAGAPIKVIKDKNGTVLFNVTSPPTKYGNRGVELVAIDVGGPGTDAKANILKWQPGTAPNTGVAFVKVNWLQTGSPGNQGIGPENLFRYFLVNVTGMNGNLIATCSAQASIGIPGSGTGVANYLAIWQSNTSLSQSSVYEDPSSGNIGFGTTNPLDTVDVYGDITQVAGGAISSNLYWSGSGWKYRASGVGGAIKFSDPQTNGITFYGATAASSGAGNDASSSIAPLMTLLPSGLVGIGTTAPVAALHIKARSDSVGFSGIFNESVDAGAPGYCAGDKNGNIFGCIGGVTFVTAFGPPDTTVGDFVVSSNSNIRFASGHQTTWNMNGAGGPDTSRMSIMANGNVGIGTTTPQGILDVRTPGNVSQLMVAAGGNVGVGNASPGKKLDVMGDINASSSLFAGGSLTLGGAEVCTSAGCICSGPGCNPPPSDLRLKQEIFPLANSLEKLLGLQGVSYTWRDPVKYGTGQQVGMIAQDVEKVFPQVVVTNRSTGLKSLAYDHLIAPVIEAIKTLYTRILAIEGMLSQLEIRIAKAESELAASRKENAALKKENEEFKNRISKFEAVLK